MYWEAASDGPAVSLSQAKYSTVEARPSDWWSETLLAANAADCIATLAPIVECADSLWKDQPFAAEVVWLVLLFEVTTVAKGAALVGTADDSKAPSAVAIDRTASKELPADAAWLAFDASGVGINKALNTAFAPLADSLR